MRYKYCMWSADEAGEKDHPQRVILKHAPKAYDFHPVPIADCWLFTVDEELENAPPFIRPIILSDN